VALRSEKLAETFLGFVRLASTLDCLKHEV
jgi:hypothetical protein